MSAPGQREIQDDHANDVSYNPCILELKGLGAVKEAICCLDNGKGQAGSHEIWKVGEFDRRYGKTTNDGSQFDAAEATKRRLKDAREALIALTRSIDDCVMNVQATLDALLPVSLYRGMRSIPNEIIALIFDCVYDAALENLNRPGPEKVKPKHDNDSHEVPANADIDLLRTVLRLAHVSRKFRAIVLRLPRLWSHISMAYRPSAVNFLLNTSRAASLTIVLPLSMPFTRGKGHFQLACDGFIRKILVHAWRIKNLRFYLDDDDGRGIDFMRVFVALKRNWANIGLPELETLCVRMPYNIVDEDDSNEEFYVRDFHSKWNLPRLRCLDFKNFNPTFPTPESVTHCTIEHSEGEEFNLHALAQFLRVSPSLENLTLKLKDCLPLLHEETEVCLPHLWSLTIDCHLNSESSFPKIFEQLKLPSLQALSVTLDIQSEEALEEIQKDEGKFASYFPELDKEDKTVTSLSIIIRKRPPPDIDDLDGTYLATFLEDIPALEELYIEAPHTILSTWAYLPRRRVRRLRLKNCDLFPISFFRRWYPQECRKEAIDELEEVEVEQCPSMAKEELASLLKGKRLAWLP